MSTDSRSLEAGNRSIKITHPDKVLFPEDGITKYELAEYYVRIASVALSWWRDRPLTMQRFPDGIGADGFFQKDTPDYFPDWIDRARLRKAGGEVDYLLGNSAATLAYLAGQGCITAHIGLSRVDRIDYPDRLVFDLDPSDGDFRKVQFAAARVGEMLDRLEVNAYVQSTGSRGLHVYICLDRTANFEQVRELARNMADELALRFPDQLTTEQHRDKRGDRVYLDCLRNAYGQTVVAPFAVRALPGAPVATPLDWDEALATAMSPQKFTLKNIFRRLAQKRDPWRDMASHTVSARALAERLSDL